MYKFKFAFFTLLFLLLNFTCHTIFSQKNDFFVNVSFEKRMEKETRKTLNSIKKWFIIIELDTIEFRYKKDGYFVMPEFSKSQLRTLEKQDDILFKIFNKKNRCYYGLLPTNGIINSTSQRCNPSSELSTFAFYRRKNEMIIHYYFNPRLKKEDKNFILETQKKGNSISFEKQYNLILNLIPCEKYNGEYDKGFEQYRLNINKINDF